MHPDTHTRTHVNGLFARTTWISRYQKGNTSLDLNEARDDRAFLCSSISWTICKQSVPRSKQITTPKQHHLIFTGQMLFLTLNQQCQSTEGKMQCRMYEQRILCSHSPRLQTFSKLFSSIDSCQTVLRANQIVKVTLCETQHMHTSKQFTDILVVASTLAKFNFIQFMEQKLCRYNDAW